MATYISLSVILRSDAMDENTITHSRFSTVVKDQQKEVPISSLKWQIKSRSSNKFAV